MGFDPTLPFVLLDDASPGGGVRLFTGLSGTVEADDPDGVAPALARLRETRRRHTAGFISFEAGYALEPKLRPLFRPRADGLPLLWFGLFDHVTTQFDWPDAGAAEVSALSPDIDAVAYGTAFDRIAAYIAAGDIYQANLTFASTMETHGHPIALYRALRAAQAGAYGALIHTGSTWILSFSPELFFTLEGGRLTAKPMKGTSPRGGSAVEDAEAAAALRADPKNRAENLMIVDLLRNDLSRVAKPGSVETPRLFDVESYPTIHTMTSTVTATLGDGLDAIDVLAALFPCGSVTGAPKIRAMEVIAEVEAAPRGLYTGSIGHIAPDGDAAFNVAIRTLTLAGGRVRFGMGSGIVADSTAADEWAECFAKAAFLTADRRPFDLIETMRMEDGAIPLLDRHLARLRASATRFGFAFDEAAIREMLQGTGDGRIRLLLAPSGAVAVQCSPLPASPAEPVAAKIVPLPVREGDWRLRHKTTDRAFYDDARQASGAFEVLFTRPDGHLTEGSFTNVFVERDGKLLTPASPLLPGILRAELLDTGRAIEADLSAADLTGSFFIGNALRGLLRARLA